jgi:hypothetical protein
VNGTIPVIATDIQGIGRRWAEARHVCNQADNVLPYARKLQSLMLIEAIKAAIDDYAECDMGTGSFSGAVPPLTFLPPLARIGPRRRFSLPNGTYVNGGTRPHGPCWFRRGASDPCYGTRGSKASRVTFVEEVQGEGGPMNSEERIKYITSMSAAMVTELHELMALEDRLEKLESLQCCEQKPRHKFSDGTSRRGSRPRNRLPNHKVAKLFSGSNLGR